MIIYTNPLLIIILVTSIGQLHQFKVPKSSAYSNGNSGVQDYSYKKRLLLARTKEVIEDFAEKIESAKSRRYRFNLSPPIQSMERELRLDRFVNRITDIKVVSKQHKIVKDDLIAPELIKHPNNSDLLTLKFRDVNLHMIYDTHIKFYARNTGSEPYLIRWLIKVPKFFSETVHSRSVIDWIDQTDKEVFYKMNVVDILTPPDNFTRGSFQMKLQMFNSVNITKAILFIKREIPLEMQYKEVNMSQIESCNDINQSIPSYVSSIIRRQKLSCCMNSFFVSPRQLRLNNLRSQTKINLFYCTGDCFMDNHAVKPSNKSRINRKFKDESQRQIYRVTKQTCCSPSEYYGLQVFFADRTTQVIPNFIAAKCGCP